MDKKKKQDISEIDDFYDPNEVVSNTGYTGLLPTTPDSHEEVTSYNELYKRPKPKNEKRS